MSGDGAVVDDPAPARRLVFHQAKRLAGTQERPGQVHIDDAPPLLVGQVFQRHRRRPGAGVVEQHVEAPVALDHGADQALPVRFLGRVRGDEARVCAEPFGDRLPLRLAPAGEKNSRALLDEQLRGALADAARSAGHDRHLAVEHAHVVPPSPLHFACAPS